MSKRQFLPQGEVQDVAPTGTRDVFQAFEGIERTLDRIGNELKVKARGPSFVRMLVTRDLISKEHFTLYDSLRMARNAIAHGAANLPNDAENFEFVRQADFLIAQLIGALIKLNTAGDQEDFKHAHSA